MLEGPSPVSNWRIQHRFYLEIETSIRGRLLRAATDICILVTRLTQLDLICREIWSTSNWSGLDTQAASIVGATLQARRGDRMTQLRLSTMHSGY